MKSGKRKNIILVILIILVISIIFFMYKDNKIYKEKVDNNKVTFAIMVEKARDKYVEYRSKEWPKYGYRYAYAKCVDKNKNEIGDLITFDARTDTAIMKSNKSSFCTLYFAIDKELPGIVNETFYIGKTKEQEYTNNVNEEIHITLKKDTISNTIDVIEYCLVSEANKDKCEWKELPKLDENNSFVVTDYDFGSANGEKTVYLYLKDGAKNISEPIEDSIILDTEAPSCRLWGESTTWINGDRTITYGCNDDRSGCKVEQIGNQAFTTTLRTGIIKDYTIEDNAGNTNNCSGVSANVYIDKTAPSKPTSVIRYDSATGEIRENAETWTNRYLWWGEFNATDGQSGINHYEYSTNCTGNKSENLGSSYIYNYDTNYKFCIRAVDNVGNVSGWSSPYYFKVDKTAPSKPTSVIRYDSSTGEIRENAETWTNRYLWWGEFNATDGQSGVNHYEYSTNCTGNKSENLGSSYIYNYDTNYKFCIRTVDNAGNVSGWSSPYYFKVDKTAPSCSIGGNPSSWQKTNATLTQNGTDSGEGIVYYSWDNKNSYSTIKSNKSVGSNGTYTLYVKDGVGNENSCSVYVSKIDKTPPSCVGGSNNNAWTRSKPVNVWWGCKDDDYGSGCLVEKAGEDTISGKDVAVGYYIRGESQRNFTPKSDTYEIKDNAGNTVTCKFADMMIPVLYDNYAPKCYIEPIGSNLIARLNADDEHGSGNKIVKSGPCNSSNSFISYNNLYAYDVSNPGRYCFYVEDGVGLSCLRAVTTSKSKQLYTKTSKTCNSTPSSYGCASGQYHIRGKCYRYDKAGHNCYCSASICMDKGCCSTRNGSWICDHYWYVGDEFVTGYSYSFGSETIENNVESCTPNNISCDADHSGHTYVSCTSTGSTCSDGYTEVGNYCYKLN